jgi:hypothetical protein
MKRILIIILLGLSELASAATYYVSSSTGSDANNGTSASTPWQTIAHVNGQTFQPGDSILFKRGDVWNESLAPASSGSSGNPITFDAYGTGAAPNLTGYYAVAATAWVLVTGNAWKAPVPATYTTINFCLFGSVWGQKVAAASSNLTAPWDFYLANGYVYVYSVGNPATFYGGPIVPMALSNVPVININGQSWLTFQHFLVNWFDQYGVYVQGTSDHLVFANMEADSMIPQGTQPLGFYVNESAPGPGDIKIYNAEAHLNYDGFRFDGSATAITMVNDKAYANRDGALVDNTSAVSYSYCHFYASSLAVAGSTDVEYTSGSGPTAGAGNVAPDTAPAVQAYQRYPAEVTLTVDDAGMTPNADAYYASTVLPISDAASVPVGAAITVGYPLAQTLVSEFQGWVNAGRDVTSHSMSHTYYTNTDALEIQYTGSGTAATLSISNKTLTITVTGAADGVSYNLAQGQAQGTIKGLRLALLATGKFTATEIPTCQGPYGTGCSAYTEAALLAQDLADVSGQDARTSVYSMQLDVTRLTTDEITLSRQWMTTNLTGLPATPVYVYPGGYETTSMQGITAGVPYTGARGALKEDLGVKDTYADGFDAQNITSFGVNPTWQGLQAAALNQKIQALLWKESVWGVPWGIFWHLNELSSTEITNLIQDFKTSGATIRTNTGLVNWLLGGTQETGTDGNSYYKLPATSMTLDFRPTKNSPVVNAGQNLGAGYALDINGVDQNSYGNEWEIGAHVYEGYGVYGTGAGSGRFSVGTNASSGPPNYAGSCTSYASIPPPATAPFSGLLGSGTIVVDPEPVSGGNVSGCFHNPMVRVTDAASGCNGIGEPAGSPCSRQNFSFFADSGGSGDVNHWSVNDGSFFIQDQNQSLLFYSFNPSTLVATLKYGNVGNRFGIPDSPSYSRITPDLLYDFSNAGNNTKGSILKSFSVASNTAPSTPATVVDFASPVFSGAGLASGTWFTTDPVSVNGTDTVFIDGFSPSGTQNTARMACGWTSGVGIDCWNTSTSTITSSHGPSGAVACQNCPNGATQVATFGIHNVKASLDGKYAVVGVGGTADGESLTSVTSTTGGAVSAVVSTTSIFFVGAVVEVTGNTNGGFNSQTFNVSAINVGTNTVTGTGWTGTASSTGTGGTLEFSFPNGPFLWQVGTLNVWTLCDPVGLHCSGHEAAGYLGYVNQYSTPFYAYRPLANLPATVAFPATGFTALCGVDAGVNDSHPGWFNNTGADQEAFLTTATSGPNVPSYTNCDVNEVLGIFAPSNGARSGTILRFAHTGGMPSAQFSGEYQIGSVSQTGKFYMFGSPYYNALGDTSGNFPCSVTPCRADVFIVQLK